MRTKRRNLFCLSLIALLSLPVVFAQPTCVPPPANIIAWWPLDEVNGTTAEDIIGNHTGTHFNGPKPANGTVEGALMFDGLDDYVEIANAPEFQFGLNDFTFAAWIYPTAIRGSGGFTAIMAKHNFDDGSWLWRLTSNSGTGGVPKIQFETDFPTRRMASNTQIALNTWYFIALTMQSGIGTFYLNGVPDGTFINNEIFTTAYPIRLSGQGNTNIERFTGKIDELQIFSRALSPMEIQAEYNAGSAGKCKVLQITTLSPLIGQVNTFFSQQLTAKLGQAPYTWALVSGQLPAGLTLHEDSIINGTPTNLGNFSFTVEVMDSVMNKATKTLSFEIAVTLPPPTLKISKVGTAPVPGRIVDYFVFLNNVGTITLNNLETVEMIMPYFNVTSSNPTATLINTSFSINTSEIASYIATKYNKTLSEVGINPNISVVQENISAIAWSTTILQSGETTLLHYGAKLDPATPPGTTIVGGPVCSEAQAQRALGFCKNDPAVKAECAIGLSACGKCVKERNLKACALCTIWGPLCANIFAFCMKEGFKAFCDDAEGEVQRGADPNEKDILVPRFIQSGQKLPYTIHFENIGNVSVKDIFLADNLNQELNTSRVEILVNSSFVSLLQGQSITFFLANKTQTINQTIGNMTIQINITYIENRTVTLLLNRTMQWDLLNVFLDINATDFVLFSTNPVAGLLNGTNITNKASITFEIFETIETNSTLNTIDDVQPTCVMDQLPRVTANQTILLSWNSFDPVGEIDSDTIFVSQNKGPFIPFINGTNGTSAVFPGTLNNEYGFICIATDTARNVEIQPPTPETLTTIKTVEFQGATMIVGIFRIHDGSGLFFTRVTNFTGGISANLTTPTGAVYQMSLLEEKNSSEFFEARVFDTNYSNIVNNFIDGEYTVEAVFGDNQQKTFTENLSGAFPEFAAITNPENSATNINPNTLTVTWSLSNNTGATDIGINIADITAQNLTVPTLLLPPTSRTFRVQPGTLKENTSYAVSVMPAVLSNPGSLERGSIKASINSSSFMTGSSTFINATIAIQGTPQVGQPFNLTISDSANPGLPYFLFMGISGISPGIPLPDGRVIPVNFDSFITTVIFQGNLLGFSNQVGFLDVDGNATITWNVPNISVLSLIPFYASCITVNTTLPFPQSVRSICDPPITVNIQP